MVSQDPFAVDVMRGALRQPVCRTFVLPESFHPGEFLRTPRLQRRWDDARYLVNTIQRKQPHCDSDDFGCVRLQAKFLKNIMYQADYAAVIKALLCGGAIKRHPYQNGIRSFGYYLSDRFLADKHIRVPATDPRLIKRLAADHERTTTEQRARMLPVHHALAKLQHQLEIHGDQARAILADQPHENHFDTQGILVADIETGNFHCSVGTYGRLANNITSLKRELRQTLHINGQRFACIDLSCTQPAFIAKLIDDGTIKGTDNNSNNRGNTAAGENRQGRDGSNYDSSSLHYDSSPSVPTYDDLSLFRSLVQSGEFYGFLVDRLRDRGFCISREVVKGRFMADVIAKKKVNRHGAEYQSDVEDCFRELFPTVYRLIREFNCQGWEHENLVRLLQRAESEFVIETVAADLVTRFPGVCFVTLHDAIYAPLAHLPKVEQAFQRGFEQTGFRMKFKVAV